MNQRIPVANLPCPSLGRRAFFGQVPIRRRLGDCIPTQEGYIEEVSIPANGGRIEKRYGELWFVMSEETRDKIEAGTGTRPPEAVEAVISFCNPTPGTIPVLGDFSDPASGEVCFLDLPEEWNLAWIGLS